MLKVNFIETIGMGKVKIILLALIINSCNYTNKKEAANVLLKIFPDIIVKISDMI